MVSCRGNKAIGSDTVCTSGVPAKLRMLEDVFTPERSRIAFIHVKAADARDIPCRLASNRFSIRVKGDAEVIAVGNADAMSFKSMKKVDGHELFGGNAVLYVRRGQKDSVVEVSSEGLENARLKLAAF